MRTDIHAAAWVGALERTLGAPLLVISRERAVRHPPRRGDAASSLIGVEDLRLADGRVPDGFMRTDEDGRRRPARRFETVRPACGLAPAVGRRRRAGPTLLLELELRSPAGFGIERLERYDHFLTGWSVTREPGTPPLVLFLLRDRAAALAVAALADGALTASRACPGEHPRDWEFAGRRLLRFAAEEDVHHGSLHAWRLPAHPPALRTARDPASPLPCSITLDPTVP
jgi:hypothetical protein